MNGKNKYMSVFTMSMLTVAAVLSLRNLPSQAEYGYSVIFYLVAAAVCFFVPSALVSAELASAWPEEGGVYETNVVYDSVNKGKYTWRVDSYFEGGTVTNSSATFSFTAAATNA